MSLTTRLLDKMTKTEDCWIWNAARSGSGYGVIRNENMIMEGAHQISWRIYNNKDIPADKVVMHSCDNKLCINPEHLDLGTQKENIDDMFKKGRQVVPEHLSEILSKETGEKNRNAKLTKELVLEIRHLYSVGISQREITERTGVPFANIWAIVHRKSWKHI